MRRGSAYVCRPCGRRISSSVHQRLGTRASRSGAFTGWRSSPLRRQQKGPVTHAQEYDASKLLLPVARRENVLNASYATRSEFHLAFACTRSLTGSGQRRPLGVGRLRDRYWLNSAIGPSSLPANQRGAERRAALKGRAIGEPYFTNPQHLFRQRATMSVAPSCCRRRTGSTSGKLRVKPPIWSRSTLAVTGRPPMAGSLTRRPDSP